MDAARQMMLSCCSKSPVTAKSLHAICKIQAPKRAAAAAAINGATTTQPAANPGAAAAAARGAPLSSSKEMSPELLWRLREWTGELLRGGGYNTLMDVMRKELAPGLTLSRLGRVSHVGTLLQDDWF